MPGIRTERTRGHGEDGPRRLCMPFALHSQDRQPDGVARSRSAMAGLGLFQRRRGSISGPLWLPEVTGARRGRWVMACAAVWPARAPPRAAGRGGGWYGQGLGVRRSPRHDKQTAGEAQPIILLHLDAGRQDRELPPATSEPTFHAWGCTRAHLSPRAWSYLIMSHEYEIAVFLMSAGCPVMERGKER